MKKSTTWRSDNLLLKESNGQGQGYMGKVSLEMEDFSEICRAYCIVKDNSSFTTPHIADIMDKFFKLRNISYYDWNVLDAYTVEAAKFLNKHRFPYSTKDSEGDFDFVPKYEK